MLAPMHRWIVHVPTSTVSLEWPWRWWLFVSVVCGLKGLDDRFLQESALRSVWYSAPASCFLSSCLFTEIFPTILVCILIPTSSATSPICSLCEYTGTQWPCTRTHTQTCMHTHTWLNYFKLDQNSWAILFDLNCIQTLSSYTLFVSFYLNFCNVYIVYSNLTCLVQILALDLSDSTNSHSLCTTVLTAAGNAFSKRKWFKR